MVVASSSPVSGILTLDVGGWTLSVRVHDGGYEVSITEDGKCPASHYVRLDSEQADTLRDFMAETSPATPSPIAQSSEGESCGLCEGPLPCLTHSQGLSSSSAASADPVAWQYRLQEHDGWSGWQLISKHFHDAIAADKSEGRREDYELRQLYASPQSAVVAQPPRQPTEAMLNAARDWSCEKYGKPIGNDAAIGCWLAMHGAATLPLTEGK